MPTQFNWTDIGDVPLVTCVMPTFGRPKLVPESVAMFLQQDYPNKELILLNDCPTQHYRFDHPQVRVFNWPTRFPTLGEKRNQAIDMSRGSLLAVWDDDDVYLPWRLSYSVRRMVESRIPFFLAQEYWAYWGEDELHHNQAVPGWIGHPLAMFRRELWDRAGRYSQLTLGEDADFFRRVFETLGTTWISHEIESLDRFMVLRGKSEYHHTSIGGGIHPVDTTPGHFEIVPRPIEDSVLRRSVERLVEQRKSSMYPVRHSPQSHGIPWGQLKTTRYQFLDDRVPSHVRIGYGELGRHGDLGYTIADGTNRHVEVGGQRFAHALSAHGSSELRFVVEGAYDTFISQVALNDDVPPGESSADFLLFADGNLTGVAANVRPHDVRRTIVADIRGATELTLVVRARRWDYCHSVWIEPRIGKAAEHTSWELTDCLGFATMSPPTLVPEAELAIVTVGSPGFEPWIDDLLGSISANGQCPEAQRVLFFFGESAEATRIAEKHQALLIPCRSHVPLGPASKAVLYSAGRVVRAAKLICLDADMLALDDLRPIVAAMDAHPPGTVLTCREAAWAPDLNAAVQSIYGGRVSDIASLLNGANRSGSERNAGSDNFVVNDGLFAGTRAALCGVDSLIREMTTAASWIQQGPAWRNQFVFNLALAHLHCGVELDPKFNVQLNCQAIDCVTANGMRQALANGRPASVVHFNGGGRAAHPELRGAYRAVSTPLTNRTAAGDGYRLFVDALRRWIGQHGTECLTWSFYGTSDGCSARVADSSFFPLLATLHSLVRSNGCSRIVETGTANGVSAACLASAIAHRQSACVVTLDPAVFPKREQLWSFLPEAMRRCIHARQVDGLSGMADAIRAGETFHAALLDSIHTCEHVLQEFTLASQLVCPGGLILIHDPLLYTGTVGNAIDQIASNGYRVVRLWAADEGAREDDRLGLAVVENRRVRA